MSLHLKYTTLTMKRDKLRGGEKSNQLDTESETEVRIETYPEF